jgi:hypothetical protein
LKNFEKLISTAMFSKRNKICNYPGWFHPWIKPLAPSPTNALNKSGKTSTNHKTKHSKHANKCEKRTTCKHITSKIKKWSKNGPKRSKTQTNPSTSPAVSERFPPDGASWTWNVPPLGAPSASVCQNGAPGRARNWFQPHDIWYMI